MKLLHPKPTSHQHCYPHQASKEPAQFEFKSYGGACGIKLGSRLSKNMYLFRENLQLAKLTIGILLPVLEISISAVTLSDYINISLFSEVKGTSLPLRV